MVVTKFVVENWSDLSNEDMSLEAIRKIHTPREAYYISQKRYAAGVEFPVSTSKKHYYVLGGSCEFSFIPDHAPDGTLQTDPDGPVIASAGQRIWIPYPWTDMKTLGSEPFRFVIVWRLPEEILAKSRS